eukprot:698944-Amphidinium_carterae.1
MPCTFGPNVHESTAGPNSWGPCMSVPGLHGCIDTATEAGVLERVYMIMLALKCPCTIPPVVLERWGCMKSASLRAWVLQYPTLCGGATRNNNNSGQQTIQLIHKEGGGKRGVQSCQHYDHRKGSLRSQGHALSE